jgi:hypothetical protein
LVRVDFTIRLSAAIANPPSQSPGHDSTQAGAAKARASAAESIHGCGTVLRRCDHSPGRNPVTDGLQFLVTILAITCVLAWIDRGVTLRPRPETRLPPARRGD